MRLGRVIIRSASWLVPGEQRPEWLLEWNSELWHVSSQRKPGVTHFCLGAFRDALWLRSYTPIRLRSPVQCVLLLALLAAVCIFFAPRASPWMRQPLFAHVLVFVISLVILPVTTSLSLGE